MVAVAGYAETGGWGSRGSPSPWRSSVSSGARSNPGAKRDLVVVGEVAPGAEKMIERHLEVVLVAVGEIRHLGVERGPGGAPPRSRPRQPAARAQGEGVAHRFLIGR